MSIVKKVHPEILNQGLEYSFTMENHVGRPASRSNDPNRRQSEPKSASSTKSKSSSKIQAHPKQDDGKPTYGLGPILEPYVPNQYHKVRSVKTPHRLQPTYR